jgi:hypothetical protein
MLKERRATSGVTSLKSPTADIPEAVNGNGTHPEEEGAAISIGGADVGTNRDHRVLP